MKNTKTILAIMAACAFPLSHQALASDGTINFTGKIEDITCTINVDSGSATSTVTLPAVPKSALGAIGSTAGDTPFTIKLTGCTGTGVSATAKDVAVYFEPGGNVNAAGRLNNTISETAAEGVDVALYRANSPTTPLMLGVIPTAGYAQISTGTPTATMNFVAKYYATTAAVDGGDVTTSATYSIVYP